MTGRPRRTGWLDLPLLRYSGMINGTSWLVVTKLDVLDELAEIPVCVGYKIDGKTDDEAPAQASGYDKIECIYEKLPGWKTSTEGITDTTSCRSRRANIWRLSRRKLDAKIGMISTGPDRDHTILIDDFVSGVEDSREESLELLPRRRPAERKERTMVVLAVTWMAKVGHEAEVAALLKS